MGAKPSSSSSAVVRPSPTFDHGEMRIEEVLSYLIFLSYQIFESIKNPYCSKIKCSETGKKVARICQIIRSLARLVTSQSSFYERPLRRILADVSRLFERSLTLVKVCCRRSLFFIVKADAFRSIFFLLDNSVYDMIWVHSTLGGSTSDAVIYLPPIACNEPILTTVWSSIASLHADQLKDRIEAANVLDSLARDNHRYRMIIVEEGGIPPLLKLLEDPSSSSEAQIAAAATLSALAHDENAGTP